MISNEYLPLIAIFISTASFLISLKTASFNRKAKSIEMKSSLLVKALDVSNGIFELLEFYDAAQNKAEKLGNVKMFKAFDKTNISKTHEKHNRILDKIKSTPTNRWTGVYSDLFHDIHEAGLLVSSLKAKSSEMYEEFLKEAESK